MMTEVTKVIYRVPDEEVFDHLTCDMCGAESDCNKNWPSASDDYHMWSQFEKNRTKLTHVCGTKYPGGGILPNSDCVRTTWHICEKCFGEIGDFIRNKNPDAKPTVIEDGKW
jgi:hypothetical protein